MPMYSIDRIYYGNWGQNIVAKQVHRAYYKQNRLQQLRGFCYAAKALSISKAAQKMFLSQPSVSLQIQALERELGVVLFERYGPKISLTPDGEALLVLATPLVEGMDNLPASFAARREEIGEGRLDVAAGESTILYILPELVHAFSKRYPRIELKLHNVTGQTGLKMLRAGEVDFAVGSMIDTHDDIVFAAIWTYAPMLITPMDCPLADRKRVSMKDIAAEPLILPPRQLTTYRLIEAAMEQRGLNYHVRVEAGGWEVIKKYVQIGLGVSIVPSFCLTGDEPVRSISVKGHFPERTYGVVLRKGRFLSPQAKEFIRNLSPLTHDLAEIA